MTTVIMNPNVKEVKEEDLQSNPSIICGFCSRNKINTLEWGTMFNLGNIYVHYFCLLFSASLSQRGEDEQGILGFMPKDINKEFNRGKKLKCTYCKQKRATVGCSLKTCKKSFHYTCGYENLCNFQFIGKFESYCPLHKPKINIYLENPEDWVCPICFCQVERHEGPISPPCCKKAVFHRKCLMIMATTHGYFFKCPLCNDKQIFEREMKISGVYVPQMDAAWERDPNAFADQVMQYSTCDADECHCPHGRNHQEKETKWNLSRCAGCGSSAMHKECGQLPTFSWRCHTCQTILAGTGLLSSQSSEESDTGAGSPSQNRSQLGSRSARICRSDFYADNDYKSSSEDDEPVDNVVEVLQWTPNVEELEKEIDAPTPVLRHKSKKMPTMLHFNHMIDPENKVVYDGFYQRKYKVEGGERQESSIRAKEIKSATVIDKPSENYSTSSCKPTLKSSIQRKKDSANDSIRKLPDSAVVMAVNINSLMDVNFQEKIAQLKSRVIADKMTGGDKYNNEQNEVEELEFLELQSSSLDFVGHPKITRRKLDFNARNASLPPIQIVKSESLRLGPETHFAQIISESKYLNTSDKLVHSYSQDIISEANSEISFSDLAIINKQSQMPSHCPILTQQNPSDNLVLMSEEIDSPELCRSSWTHTPSIRIENTNRPPISKDHLRLNEDESLLTKEIIKEFPETPSESGRRLESNSNNSQKNDVEIIDLDEEDDDIQICDYIHETPLKIRSVTSLNPEQSYVPKSAAFMNMLNRFKEQQSRPWSRDTSKENNYGAKVTSKGTEDDEIVILDSDDDDLEVVGVYTTQNHQRLDDCGDNETTAKVHGTIYGNSFVPKTCGDRSTGSPEKIHTKRLRLSEN